jgi:beta-glucosidase
MNDIEETVCETVCETVSQLTLEEKASLCSGQSFWHLKSVERLGIPSIMITDGPHGLRKQPGGADDDVSAESTPATCFPTASALAATWNRGLVYQVGVALAEECLQEEVSVILGPGANIKRSPLCGRNFEYFSEDPYLSGEIAASHINGVQSQGVGTSLKHYVANNQETRRMTIDTLVDERTLREIYLAGYEMAVKAAQPWTVMCAYNRINGTYASDHKVLLHDVLREEWGYEGLVVTDWGAMNERVTALQAGCDLEMPGVANGNDAKIVAAVRSGELDEGVLDRTAARVLTLIAKAQNACAKDAPTQDAPAPDFSCDMAAHHALARRVAGEGAVLLKNEGQLLPLPVDADVALIGRFAKHPRYQGAGSSQIIPTRLDNLYDELANLIGEDRLTYAPGYTDVGDTEDEARIQEALAVAENADVIVICAGLTDLYEVEGVDRSHMKLPAGHNALIQRVAAAHTNVVVVLSNGSPVEMPWVDDVPAVLEGYLGGQAGAGALADILTGKVNPSGKLAETFPIRWEDTPAHPYPSGPAAVEYREGLYVGYRYYDTADVAVRFPFGHGSSYTTFAYRDLSLTPSGDTLTARLKVKNTGLVAGQEIVQLYVRDVASTVFRPDKELKGFVKVSLAPGEETDVTMTLDRRAFAFYDVGSRDWVVEAGDVEILVGASSRDIRLTAPLHLAHAHGTASPVDKAKLSAYYHVSQDHRFTQADFEALLGKPVPPPDTPQKGSYTLNTPISEMSGSWIGRQLYRWLKGQIDSRVGGADTPMGAVMHAVIKDMPLRNMMMFGGPFNRARLEALLVMINGRVLKGVLALVGTAFSS